MINIRKNLFETNSSSCHSIVYSSIDRGYDFNLPVDSNGTLEIEFDEFGWGPAILKTPIEKLSYYITDHAGKFWYDDYSDPEKLVDNLKKFERKPDILELVDLIKSKCPQIKDVKFKLHSGYYQFGYIDHESTGTSYVDDVFRLIFSNGAIIIIDNDNNFYYEDYYFDEFEKGSGSNKDPEELFN